MGSVGAFIYDRQGVSHRSVDADLIDRVVAELDDPIDDEHPDVSVQTEDGWSLSAYQSGLIVWENVEGEGAPRHRTRVSRAEVAALFRHVVRGELEVVEAEAWLPGYH